MQATNNNNNDDTDKGTARGYAEFKFKNVIRGKEAPEAMQIFGKPQVQPEALQLFSPKNMT